MPRCSGLTVIRLLRDKHWGRSDRKLPLKQQLSRLLAQHRSICSLVSSMQPGRAALPGALAPHQLPGRGVPRARPPEAASPRFCAFVNLCLTMSSPHPREPLRPAGGGMSFRGLAEFQGSGLLLPQMLQKQDQRLWKELFKRFSGRPAFPFSGSPVPSIPFQDLCAPWPCEPALPRPGARSAAAAGEGTVKFTPQWPLPPPRRHLGP